MGTNSDYLSKKLKTKDSKVILSTLAALRCKLDGKRPRYTLDSDNFKTIVSYLKLPNHKILNYSLSILANCCIYETYRKYFGETEGVHDLLVIIKSIDSDDLTCRAWRLASNIAMSPDICKALLNGDISSKIASYLTQLDTLSSGTRDMVFRTIRKCWTHRASRLKLTTDDFSTNLRECLKSQNKEIVQMTLQLYSLLLSHPNACTVDKGFIMELVDLSKNEVYLLSSMKCLSAIVSHHLISHLIEGSGLAETFISYLKTHKNIERQILEAFCKLCSEGGVRNKVKNSELFPTLIHLCRGSNVHLLLMAFVLFQFDLPSIEILSQSDDLISVLVENVASRHAIKLLTVIARLEKPIPSLISDHNLDVFVESSQCVQLLSTIVGCKRYFKNILLSGKVWAICLAGCPMDEVGSSGYGEGVIEHCLVTGDDRRKRVVSLAVPFLVKPRNFKLLYKLLAKHHAMNIILQALDDSPTDESTVASVVRLAQLFREQHKADMDSKDLDGAQLLFLEDHGEKADSNNSIEMSCPRSKEKGEDVVTFELDSGTCVTLNKATICTHSPVINAMLNGHFVESGQERVKLQNCSAKALASLGMILEGLLSPPSLTVEVYLELISLTDRLLIPEIGDSLTRAFTMSGENCAQVYLWSRHAGHAPNVSRLRARAYWALLSSMDQLLPALRSTDCRGLLTAEISAFLTNCLNDLL